MGAMISPFAHDALERRYDGPIPPADPAACLVPAAQRARLFQRLAKDVREQAARHRLRLSAPVVLADEKLHRLVRDLGRYRAQGVAWLQP